MSLPTIIDHVVQGLDRMLWQWKDKPNATGLIQSYLESAQEVEDVFFQLLNERGINTAIGAQLDVIGDLVGEPRLGRDDDTYRAALLNRVILNSSTATPAKMVEVVSLLTITANPSYFEHYPASFIMASNNGVTPGVIEALQSAKPAGVATDHIFFRQSLNTVRPVELVTGTDNLIVQDAVPDIFNLITDNTDTFTVASLQSAAAFNSILAEFVEARQETNTSPLAEVVSL